MRALCARVTLGSETHYSNPVWVVLCEEQIYQCVHLCSYVFVAMLDRDSELSSIPSNWKWCCKFINSLASLFRFNDYNCNATSNLSNCRVCVGNESEQLFVFYWSTPMAAREFLKECQSKKCNCFENPRVVFVRIIDVLFCWVLCRGSARKESWVQSVWVPWFDIWLISEWYSSQAPLVFIRPGIEKSWRSGVVRVSYYIFQ